MMRTTIEQVLALLEIAYGKKSYKYSEMNEDCIELYICVWQGVLGDLSPEDVFAATLAWVQSQTWPPTPSDIRKKILARGIPDAGDQWAKVKRCFGHPERLNELAEHTQKAVRDMGGLSAIGSSREDTARAHFMQIYNSCAAQAAEKALVAPAIRQQVEKLTSDMLLIEGKDES